MKLPFVTYFLPLLLGFSFIQIGHSQKVAEPFEFEFEGNTLRGLIERPQDREPDAFIIMIPGSGRTNFVEGGWYSSLRDQFVQAGLAVCFWDKMGCGQSEGVFDELQPVDNSAAEALVAIQKIKGQNLPGSDKLGLWGLSRGGWICPLIIGQHPIDFWISVSGTDDKENYGYLLKSNLLIAGKTPEEAETLYRAWLLGQKLFCTRAPYEDVLAAIRPLQEDSLSRALFGYSEPEPITDESRAAFLKERATYTSTGHFDEASGLWVVIEGFEEKLREVEIPVLALFGANDSQVDWRKTKALYERTIGQAPAADLTIKVFENCNHNLQKCQTCAFGEDLSALQWQACDGYYETMHAWLREQGVVK